MGSETLLFLAAVGLRKPSLQPPGGKMSQTHRYIEADVDWLRAFRKRGRPGDTGTVAEHAAWYLEERKGFDGETLRRYRQALMRVCEIHPDLKKNKVDDEEVAEYLEARKRRVKDAGENVAEKTLKMESWLHQEIAVEGYSVADLVRLTGLNQNSLSQRIAKRQYVPEIPFGRSSERQLRILQSFADLRKGGMPPNWFCTVLKLLEQGRRPRFDRNLRKLVEDSRNGYQVLYPPEPARARERELPADREQWTGAELWEEYAQSPAFTGKPSPKRRETFAATMTNHWLPEIDKKSIREIRADVVGVVGGSLERIAAKEDINSEKTLVTLRNNLQEVLATVGISVAAVPIPDVEPKGAPLTHQDHGERRRQIHAIYQRLKELETVEDRAQRKAAGLHALPGPWADLVLLLFSPAPRPLEAMPLNWQDLIEGSGGTEINIAKRQSLDDTEPEPVSHDARRRVPAGRVDSVLQWRPQAKHQGDQDPIFANPRVSPAKPYRRNKVWRHVLKDVGRKLPGGGAGWVSLEAIREEGIYWLEKLLQSRMRQVASRAHRATRREAPRPSCRDRGAGAGR